MSEDRTNPPEWAFDQVQAAFDSQGLKGVAMRVSRTADDGVPVFMHLSKAKRLRDALDKAIQDAETGTMPEPPISDLITKGPR